MASTELLEFGSIERCIGSREKDSRFRACLGEAEKLHVASPPR